VAPDIIRVDTFRPVRFGRPCASKQGTLYESHGSFEVRLRRPEALRLRRPEALRLGRPEARRGRSCDSLRSPIGYKMKRLTSLISGLVALTLSTLVLAATMTNGDYFEYRRILRSKEDLTEFQAQKHCQALEGMGVHFRSYAIEVYGSGTILADMDGAKFLSLPDIRLNLLDDDQTAGIKQGQTIEYTGSISGCRFNKTTGTLALGISGGRLLKHY